MKINRLNSACILLLMLFVSISTFAQRDKDFWFALPTVSQSVDGSPPALNQPDSLRITAYGQAAHVILSIPANPGSSFNSVYGSAHPITVPALTTVSIGLTAYLSDLESRPPDVVTNDGLHVTSDQAISVYYELANYENGNFWLFKGRNAVGSNFYIPGQTFMPNVSYTNSYNTMNIVATSDGDPGTHLTTVNITPSNDVVNSGGGSHAAGTTYTVTLGLGQVITAQDLSTAYNMKLAGSTVTSDYPIAVTEADDYMASEQCSTCGFSGGYWDNGVAAHDAGGDQIVPTNVIGTEYIAVRGGLTVNPEKIFVLTTRANTNIYQDGALVTSTTMPVPTAGTTVMLDMVQSNVSSYITADKLVYVSQVSGMISEPGWNQLPPITTCSGSTSVAYYRTFANSDNGVILLLATNGGQNSFHYYINGVLQSNPLPVVPTWTAVPGAPAGWVATRINVGATVNYGDAIIVTNSTPFTMGVVTGANDGAGSSSNATGLFGYFSNFGGLDIQPVANTPCFGDTLFLTADSLVGGLYSWSGPAGFTSNVQNPFIYPFPAADTGEYYLTVTSGTITCTSYDSVRVAVNPTCCPLPHIVLNRPDTVCSGGTITLTDTLTGVTSLWSTGAATSSITVSTSGTYWLRATNGSCIGSDTVRLVFITAPGPFSLGNDTEYCGSFTRTLSTGNPSSIWSTGVTASSISVSAPGTYWAIDTNICGSSRDSITISVKPGPVVNLGNDTTLCNGSTLLLNAATDSATYLWQNGTTDSILIVSTQGTYRVVVTVDGCSAADSVIVFYTGPPAPFSLGSDTTYCGSFVRILSTGSAATTIWSTGVVAVSSITVSLPGTYWAIDSNICGSTIDSITISEKPRPAVNIGDDTTLCIGSTLLLNAATDSATYLWQNGTTDSTFTVSSAGTYRVIVTVNGCSVTDSIEISYIGPPSIKSLGSDTSICEDSTLLLDAYIQTAHYIWSNGDTLPYITVSQTGTYTVTVSDACGSATASENVTVAECTCKIAIPTAFSPNGDGKNDYYYVLTQCPLENFEFDIYNRWGQKIFTTDTVTGKWDGTYKGAKQPLGVYVYFLKYTDPYTGLDHSQTGNVTLMR